MLRVGAVALGVVVSELCCFTQTSVAAAIALWAMSRAVGSQRRADTCCWAVAPSLAWDGVRLLLCVISGAAASGAAGWPLSGAGRALSTEPIIFLELLLRGLDLSSARVRIT